MKIRTNPADFDPSFLDDYRRALPYLTIRLSGPHDTERLSRLPHRMLSDMILTPEIICEKSETACFVFTVTEEIRECWGISEEKLFSDALSNPSPDFLPVLLPLSDVVDDMLRNGKITFKGPSAPSFYETVEQLALSREKTEYVLTNGRFFHGASVIARPGVLEETARAMDSDLYLLPSSVHEFIILPGSLPVEPGRISSLVAEITETEVSPTERLAYRAYLYERRTGNLKAL